MNRIMASAAVVTTIFAASVWASAESHKLTGWAALPSTTLVPGPVSGQFIGAGPFNGVVPPFAGQVVPGYSGFIPAQGAPGQFTALPDNGFGSKGNSPDYMLGYYTVTPNFKTTGNGTTNPGSVTNGAFVRFNDANGLLNNGAGVEQQIVADLANYPNSVIPVDPAITNGRNLTGADFDVESIARMNDGSYWVGEEFGPFMLHFNAQGTLINEPVPHPVLRAPQNPMGEPANLPSSRGFESMTRNADGSKLYLTTESSINSEPDKRMLEIYEFDTATAAYTPNTFKYRKEGPSVNNQIVTGDMTHVADDRYIVLERDNFEGPAAELKSLYLIDLSETDGDGVLLKREIVDLLDIADPLDIGGFAGPSFELPIQSVECVTVVDEYTLAVAVDTNYPFGNGRNPGSPDDTEIITIQFDVPLASLEVPEPSSMLVLAALMGVATLRRR